MAIFLASLLGSAHCVSMCGGVVLAYSGLTRQPHRAHFSYHFGRLISYLCIGAVAGLFGERINLLSQPLGIRSLAPLLMGVLLTAWGLISLLRPGVLKGLVGSRAFGILGAPSREVMKRGAHSSLENRAFLLGLGTGLLPCGWLYGFVAVATATGSPGRGAAAMAAFWLGSLPALTSLGLFSHLLSDRMRAIVPRVSALLVLLAGLAALTGHVFGVPFLHDSSSHSPQQLICAP